MSDVVEWEEVGTSELSPSVEKQRKEVLTEAVENPPDYTIHLEEDGAILTPLKIPDYSELESGKTKNSDRICFLIENRKDEVSTISIEVFDGEKLVYSEQDVDKYRPHGVHKWYWNGADNAGVIDTKVLKSKSLKVRLVAKNKKAEQVLNLLLKNKASKVDWVDVAVDLGLRGVMVELRPSFSDGGVKGSGTVLTSVEAKANGTSTPAPKSFHDLKILAGEGIEHYWSRKGSRCSIYAKNNMVIDAPISVYLGVFKVDVKVRDNELPKSGDFPLQDELRPIFSRSTSLWLFRKIARNTGYWMNAGFASSYADSDFKHTAAHEIGHFILNKYGGVFSYSWVHKHTSTLAQGEVDNTPVPKDGEVDLMHYTSDKQINYLDYWDRAVAAEQDVKGLIWMSRVEFNE